MFMDIEDTSGVRCGDILYLKDCSSTDPLYWFYAVRVEKIDSEDYITAKVPDRSVIAKINADSWNENPDFDNVHETHTEPITVSRLMRRVTVDTSCIDDFLSEFSSVVS